MVKLVVWALMWRWNTDQINHDGSPQRLNFWPKMHFKPKTWCMKSCGGAAEVSDEERVMSRHTWDVVKAEAHVTCAL